ncbi:MAG: peptidase M23 [Chitinophagaceae bacterium]|nr:MAG: peptidase M23 [Chitinophagaceae bacterium]
MKPLLILMCIVVMTSCRTTSRPGLFSKKTPHEIYSNKINEAGLQSTALGRSWFNAAALAVAQPISVVKPYKETGYFSGGTPSATGLKFSATRGEKLRIFISKKPSTGFKLYLDLWHQDTTRISSPELVASTDTTGLAIEHEVEKSGNYILRLQPELLQDCEYTIEISAVASLAYPIRASGKNHIQSYWGADRDAGARRHEGVDIFASRRTPVVAAADGRVTRVNENNLGGKVVWMRPENKDYTLYYAHLDTQLVKDGQKVKTGDTLGLMGNTGNARTTPPHLHFGVYTYGGAIDPLPFVNPDYPVADEIKANVSEVGKRLRTSDKTNILRGLPGAKSAQIGQLPKNTLLNVDAATGEYFRVNLPNGQKGFINRGSTGKIAILEKLVLKKDRSLYTLPDTLAPVKRRLPGGASVVQLAEFRDFDFVEVQNEIQGWILK